MGGNIAGGDLLQTTLGWNVLQVTITRVVRGVSTYPRQKKNMVR